MCLNTYYLVELKGIFVLLSTTYYQLIRVPVQIIYSSLVSLVSKLNYHLLTSSSSVPPKSLGISNPVLIKSHILTFLSDEPLANMLAK
jgi:hypothetical protein